MAAFQYGEPRPTEHELWRREVDRKLRLASIKKGLQLALDIAKVPDIYVVKEKIEGLIAKVDEALKNGGNL